MPNNNKISPAPCLAPWQAPTKALALQSQFFGWDGSLRIDPDPAPDPAPKEEPQIENPAAVLAALERQKAERREALDRAARAESELSELKARLEAQSQESAKQAELLSQLTKAIAGDGAKAATGLQPDAVEVLKQFQLDQALEKREQKWRSEGEILARQQLQPEIEKWRSQAESLEQQTNELRKRYSLQEQFLNAGGKPAEFEGFYRLCGSQFVFDAESGCFTQVLNAQGQIAIGDDAVPLTPGQALQYIRQGKGQNLVSSPTLISSAFEKWNQASGGGTPSQLRRGSSGGLVRHYNSVAAAMQDNRGMTSSQFQKALREGQIVIES